MIFATAALASCATNSNEDGIDDPFATTDGKADGGLSEAEIAGVLELINEATLDVLVDGVGLTSLTAKNIVNHRAGADASLGTADDDAFDDLAELDAVPYVGQRSLEALLAYARANGYVADGMVGGDLCKKQHLGQTPSGFDVVVCDELYDSPPYVRVPAPVTENGKITMQGGVVRARDLILYGADGAPNYLDTNRQLPAAVKLPEQLFAIYEVTGTPAADETIVVDSIKPVAWIPGAVMDPLLAGTWEMLASGRTGNTDFGRMFDQNIPVRVRFTLSSVANNPQPWTREGTDGMIARGQVDNLDKQVTAADGTCLASLNSLGAGSPFYMASADSITLWRHPNMHGLNDSVIVMDYPPSSDLSMNGMGTIGPFGPAGLVRAAGPDYSRVEIFPHATPTGHVVWNLAKVTGGGEPCQ
ncbi:MAG: hypothetical protein AB7R00_06155 [Kofleriaceae bacterium]